MSNSIWILGNNIDTDLIVPSHVLTADNDAQLLAATLESILPDFARNVSSNDIILAGSNFGCGSSREEAVYVLKKLGIRAILAESFSRIYFRNCINLGLFPIKISKEDLEKIGALSTDSSLQRITFENLEVNLEQGLCKLAITDSNYLEFSFDKLPAFIIQIVNAGGIVPYLKRTMG